MTWQGGDSVEATRRRGDPIEMPEFVFDLIVWAALVGISYVGGWLWSVSSAILLRIM